jgi:putative toxin-antitoxin system antitoxin component (TIGR02293 family)
MQAVNLFDSKISFSSLDDKNVFSLIEIVRKGITFTQFFSFANKSPFSLSEWSHFLHLSERTMQRYKVEKKTFDSLQSEKIVEITLLYKKGIEVFGTADYFNIWLEAENIALGKIKPKSLFDSSFGLNLLKDELTRIEHGVLA